MLVCSSNAVATAKLPWCLRGNFSPSMQSRTDFEDAVSFLKSYKRPAGMREPTNEEKLYMYARFKQATVGDNPKTSYPHSYALSFQSMKENKMW